MLNVYFSTNRLLSHTFRYINSGIKIPLRNGQQNLWAVLSTYVNYYSYNTAFVNTTFFKTQLNHLQYGKSFTHNYSSGQWRSRR